jgi:outer membrane protein
MKYLVRFFVVTFLLLISTYSLAETSVVYVDMKYILNNSKAGKGAQDYLQKTFKANQKKYADLEKVLKKDEADLLGKKTVLSKEEYQKKSDELRKKVIDYQSNRRSSLDKITKQRSEARKKLLDVLTPILNTYIQENNISLILDKRNILGGNSKLDITEIITEKLNKEIPSLNLK